MEAQYPCLRGCKNYYPLGCGFSYYMGVYRPDGECRAHSPMVATNSRRHEAFFPLAGTILAKNAETVIWCPYYAAGGTFDLAKAIEGQVGT